MTRGWIWLAIGLIWFAAVFVWTFDFTAHQFGGFGIYLPATRLVPKRTAPYLAMLILCMVLLGWIIPLGIGVYRLAAKRRVSSC